MGSVVESVYHLSVDVALSVPEDPQHGDLTSAVAMKVGKQLKCSPLTVAERLAGELRSHPDVERIEVAAPGYLNITLRLGAKLRQLGETRDSCIPQPVRAAEASVIIEYSDPNIAKPMGIHHILSTVIGQCIVNLYRHAGYHVVAWNYIGDWGTQFGNLAVAVEKWGGGKRTQDYTIDDLLALYVRFHREVETDPSLEEAGRAAFRRLEQGDPDLHAFWEDVVAVTKASLSSLYDRLHVSFDEVKGESAYQSKMTAVLEEGKRKGVFRQGKEGALVVEFPPAAGLPTYMVLKSDGATLYATRDLAMVRERTEQYHPQVVLYVVDVAQSLYFQQLFATVRMLGWEIPHLEHVVFGRMRFPDKAMSTRKGTVLKLEEVLDEAVQRADTLIAEHESEVSGGERECLAEMMGVGSVVYTILSQSRTSDIVFTWEKALAFEGNSAPYLQYTHARTRSVLRKAGVASSDTDLPKDLRRVEPPEALLLRALLQFPSVLEEARRDAMPHKLTQFLYQLCQSYNRLYNVLPILEAGEPQRAWRLVLTALTADVLRTGTELLTLRVPDRM